MDALPPEDADEADAVAEDFLRAAIIVPEKRRKLSDNVWLKLSALEPAAFAGLIGNEHPQTIALIFSKLEPAASARLSKALPAPLVLDALRRLLHMKGAASTCRIGRRKNTRRCHGAPSVDFASAWP